MLAIGIVCPHDAPLRSGNRVTAQRWRATLEAIGFEARTLFGYRGEPCDALVVLHARRGAAAVRAFDAAFPTRPIVVALTGTDVYGELDRDARETLERADRLVALQPAAIERLAPHLRHKAVTIYQSVATARSPPAHRSDAFEIAVIGGLRAVKDPLRAALAARTLPPSSRARVTCIGPIVEDAFEALVAREIAENPRFRYRGALSYEETACALAASDVLALTSRSEGGANVVGEAVVAGVPIVASEIDGTTGLLGADYPGYVPVADTAALARLLFAVETDAAFRDRLRAATVARRPLFAPERERRAWAALLGELLR